MCNFSFTYTEKLTTQDLEGGMYTAREDSEGFQQLLFFTCVKGDQYLATCAFPGDGLFSWGNFSVSRH